MLIIAATELELDFVVGAETLVCGVGPVEAALSTAWALERARPSAVLHIGIAGARTLGPGSLVVGSEAVYCDAIDPTTTLPRIERIEPSATLLDLARRVLPDASSQPIATAARVGGGRAYCDVEAMEGFGVLRAAAHAGVPALELRAISNRYGDVRAAWRVGDALEALSAAVSTLLRAVDA